MHNVIQQIRDTCNELRPSLLSDAGLIGALRELLAQTQLRVQFQIQFDVNQFKNIITILTKFYLYIVSFKNY